MSRNEAVRLERTKRLLPRMERRSLLLIPASAILQIFFRSGDALGYALTPKGCGGRTRAAAGRSPYASVSRPVVWATLAPYLAATS